LNYIHILKIQENNWRGQSLSDFRKKFGLEDYDEEEGEKTEGLSIFDFNEELLSEFDYMRFKILEKRIFVEKNEFFLTVLQTIPETLSFYKLKPWNELAKEYAEALRTDTSYEENETLIEYSLEEEDAYQMEFWDLDFAAATGLATRVNYLRDEKGIEDIHWKWDRFSEEDEEELD